MPVPSPLRSYSKSQMYLILSSSTYIPLFCHSWMIRLSFFSFRIIHSLTLLTFRIILLISDLGSSISFLSYIDTVSKLLNIRSTLYGYPTDLKSFVPSIRSTLYTLSVNFGFVRVLGSILPYL